MLESDSNQNPLEKEFGAIIESLDLPEMQKRFISSRWLDQVLWMERKAGSAQKRYYALRLIAIVGGVIVPALVGLKISDRGFSDLVHWTTFAVSLIVAISIAVEEFFHYGERWRHYRRTVESLKIEGWQFFQLAGPFQQFENHGQAYSNFAAQVEKICRQEVDVFITEVAKEKKEEKETQ